MLKTIPAFLFLLQVFSAGAQDFEKCCNQQRQVLASLYAYHFNPPEFNREQSAEVLELFMKDADERNIFFLENDRFQFRQVLVLPHNGEQFCIMARYAFAIMEHRLLQLDSMINLLEKKPVDFSKTDTITFMRGNRERILCASLDELSKRLEKRMRYEVLVEITTPRRDSFDILKVSPAELQKLKENASKRSIRRLRQYLEDFKSEKRLATHICDCMSDAIARRCDPHTNFFNPGQLNDYQDALSTEENSFGFSAGEDEQGNIIILQLVPGGAAWKSNSLNEKDVILSFKYENESETDMENMELEDFNELFYKSTAVTVELRVRKKDYKIKTVQLKKEKIRSQENVLNSYVMTIGSNRMGYIPIPSFYLDQEGDSRQGCANDVAKEIVELKQDSIRGLILDLRYNGGGSMREAMGLAGIFIDEGPVAIYKPRNGKPFLLKDLNRGSIWDGPLVILVNSASASASEFVTATLKDYNRAVIAGSTTFGKGTAQTLMLLDTTVSQSGNGEPAFGYMKITGGKFYRLTSESHQGKGIEPDVPLPGIIEKVMEKEADYPFHLQCDTVNKKVKIMKSTPLPVQELLRRSELRVLNSPKFIAIARIGDSLQQAKKKEEKVALSLVPFKKYNQGQSAFNHRVENIFTDTTNVMINVKANSENEKVLLLSEYQRKNNEMAIENLKKDIILHECIYILNDLTELIKK